MARDNNKRIKRKVRNAYVVSTVSIALVLFLLGAVGYLILGALGATQRLKENVTVYVMLEEGVSAEDSLALRTRLEGHEAVRSARYISKAEAAAEFRTYLGDDFVEFWSIIRCPPPMNSAFRPVRRIGRRSRRSNGRSPRGTAWTKWSISGASWSRLRPTSTSSTSFCCCSVPRCCSFR
ncbi:MAG: cell division protein FtsX [Alistipes onderdonkii]